MFDSTYFVMVGLLGGLAFLARRKKRDNLAYGLAILAASSFVSGCRVLIRPEDKMEGFATFLDLLRFVMLGAGVAFLAYVGYVEGSAYWKARQEREAKRIAAFQLEQKKEIDQRAAGRTPAR